MSGHFILSKYFRHSVISFNHWIHFNLTWVCMCCSFNFLKMEVHASSGTFIEPESIIHWLSWPWHSPFFNTTYLPCGISHKDVSHTHLMLGLFFSILLAVWVSVCSLTVFIFCVVEIWIYLSCIQERRVLNR